MTALDVIKKSALILNIDDVLTDSSLDTLTSTSESTCLENNFPLNRMFEILKIMLRDISSDYVQLEKEAEIESEGRSILLSQLTNCLKVISVKEGYVGVKYKVDDGEIKLSHDGKFLIKYLSCACVDSLLDEIDMFNGRVGADVLIYGLSALYCLAVGLFDEFHVYNAIYVDKLSALKTLKLINMPCRSWV